MGAVSAVWDEKTQELLILETGKEVRKSKVIVKPDKPGLKKKIKDSTGWDVAENNIPDHVVLGGANPVAAWAPMMVGQ